MRKVQKDKEMRALLKSHATLVDPTLKKTYSIFKSVKKQLAPITKESIDKNVRYYMASYMMHLRDDLGFGAKRIEESISRVMYRIDFLVNKEVTSDEMIDTIKQETGFDFDKWMKDNGYE